MRVPLPSTAGGLLSALLLLSAGCGPLPVPPWQVQEPPAAPSRSATPTAPQRSSPTLTPEPPLPEETPMPARPQVVEKAEADLAARSGTSPEDIRLLELREVEWRDTSLGCPQPGMMYAQVITPGYLLVLEARGQSYEYHADKQGNVVYCPNPEPPLESPDR